MRDQALMDCVEDHDSSNLDKSKLKNTTKCGIAAPIMLWATCRSGVDNNKMPGRSILMDTRFMSQLCILREGYALACKLGNSVLWSSNIIAKRTHEFATMTPINKAPILDSTLN
jgi:hypothetical protein